jgi:hypothetical protein
VAIVSIAEVNSRVRRVNSRVRRDVCHSLGISCMCQRRQNLSDKSDQFRRGRDGKKDFSDEVNGVLSWRSIVYYKIRIETKS